LKPWCTGSAGVGGALDAEASAILSIAKNFHDVFAADHAFVSEVHCKIEAKKVRVTCQELSSRPD
jgi:hypothetical protein